jgi:hypothetical protein
MNSYEENEKLYDGAKIQFCAVLALFAKTAQDYYLRKLRLAPSIKRKVLRCAANQTTLFIMNIENGGANKYSRTALIPIVHIG